MGAIRAARTNVRYHLRYIGFLAAKRNGLAGIASATPTSPRRRIFPCADYLGDVPWDEDGAAKAWYARVKSRPSFRPLLADRMAGMAPAAHYADLDF
jgi:glutathione S-transferase